MSEQVPLFKMFELIKDKDIIEEGITKIVKRRIWMGTPWIYSEEDKSDIDLFDPKKINDLDLILKKEKRIVFVQESSSQQKLNNLESLHQKFVDQSFPANDSSLYGQFIKDSINSSWKNIQWKPLTQYFPENQIFPDGVVSPTDIRQGLLADCYFLAGLAALAQQPRRIIELFVLEQINKPKYFSVKILKHGKWIKVDLDEMVPFINDHPAFSNSVNEGFWVILLEKAWAKTYKSYKQIENGYPEEVLHDLTGAPVSKISLIQGKYDKDDVWKQLLQGSNKNYAMVCSTRLNKPGEEKVNDKGIIYGHSYTLLDATEIQISGNKERLIKIRNPWGGAQFTGKWCDGDLKWDEISSQQKNRIQFNRSINDGIFFMSYDDFRNEFRSIDIAEIDDNASYIYESYRDEEKEGVYFTVKIFHEGQYSFQLDMAPERQFTGQKQRNYEYPQAIAIVKRIEGNSVIQAILDIKGSKKRTLQKKKHLKPGKYVAYIKINWDKNYEENCLVNLACYSSFPCGIYISSFEDAKIFTQNEKTVWLGQYYKYIFKQCLKEMVGENDNMEQMEISNGNQQRAEKEANQQRVQRQKNTRKHKNTNRNPLDHQQSLQLKKVQKKNTHPILPPKQQTSLDDNISNQPHICLDSLLGKKVLSNLIQKISYETNLYLMPRNSEDESHEQEDNKTGGETYHTMDNEKLISIFQQKRFLMCSKSLKSEFLEDKFTKSEEIRNLNSSTKIIWKQIEQIKEISDHYKNLLHSQSLSPTHLSCGKITSPTFISAISAIAEHKQAIINLFLKPKKQDYQQNTVFTRFFLNGECTSINIKGSLPFVGEQPVLSYCKSGYWLPIFEKFYIGIIKLLHQTEEERAISLLYSLTGAQIKKIELSSDIRLEDSFKNKYVNICFSRDIDSLKQKGLKPNSIYTVLKIKEHKTIKQESLRKVVYLRDAFMDARWHKEEELLSNIAGKKPEKQDGVFYMFYDDFLQCFKTVIIAQTYKKFSYYYESIKPMNKSYFSVKLKCKGNFIFKVIPERKYNDPLRYYMAIAEQKKRGNPFSMQVFDISTQKSLRSISEDGIVDQGVYTQHYKLETNQFKQYLVVVKSESIENQIDMDCLSLAAYSSKTCLIDVADYKAVEVYEKQNSENSDGIWLGNFFRYQIDTNLNKCSILKKSSIDKELSFQCSCIIKNKKQKKEQREKKTRERSIHNQPHADKVLIKPIQNQPDPKKLLIKESFKKLSEESTKQRTIEESSENSSRPHKKTEVKSCNEVVEYKIKEGANKPQKMMRIPKHQQITMKPKINSAIQTISRQKQEKRVPNLTKKGVGSWQEVSK